MYILTNTNSEVIVKDMIFRKKKHDRFFLPNSSYLSWIIFLGLYQHIKWKETPSLTTDIIPSKLFKCPHLYHLGWAIPISLNLMQNAKSQLAYEQLVLEKAAFSW